ncbi:MAG: CopD family protein [Gemmatimonadales bacterium]
MATWAAPAAAHPVLKRSIPAANDTLRSVPAQFHLEFNKVLLARLTTVELRMPGGETVRLRADSGSTRAELVLSGYATLSSGSYQLAWQVAGDDGHPVRGSLKFVVDLQKQIDSVPATPGAAAVHHPADLFPPTPSIEDEGGFQVQSPGYVAVRWVTFLALLTLVGTLTFRALVWPRLPDWRPATLPRLRVLGLGAAALLLISALARLWAQAAATAMQGEPIALDLIDALLLHSPWGIGWWLQVFGALVVAISLLRSANKAMRWMIAGIGALMAVAAMPMSGHAAAVEGFGPLPMFADALHVIGAGSWLGTLLALLVAGVPVTRTLAAGNRTDALARLVTAFSPVALSAAALVATTGVFAAWVHLGSIDALWAGGYARVLLIKLGVLSLVVATGAYNWRVVRPALLRGQEDAPIARSAGFELAIGAIVIAVTAVLVATPPAMTP